jgi:lipoyl(octanoyl) transferase
MTHSSTDRRRTQADTAALEVHLLGLVDFDAALTLQERLVFEISGREDRQGALLLCEHPPLITLGREASIADVLADETDLRSAGIEIRWVSRGGGAVVHAPGQLAVYPILPLDRLGIGLGEYRRRLEDAMIAVCRDQRIPARSRGFETGLWSRAGQVACFGASVTSWVSSHGIYLNVDPEPGFLRLVRTNPPGERSTSLQAQRVRRTSMGSVRESVIRHVVEQFGYDRFHVYTGHPLLQRTSRRVCLHV